MDIIQILAWGKRSLFDFIDLYHWSSQCFFFLIPLYSFSAFAACHWNVGMHSHIFFCYYYAGSKEIYFQQYGRHNIHKIWRDDVLPCRVYLRHWSVLIIFYIYFLHILLPEGYGNCFQLTRTTFSSHLCWSRKLCFNMLLFICTLFAMPTLLTNWRSLNTL